MKQRQTIYNALPIVAAAYGESFGVKVVIGQDTAHTDGKTIVVPRVPADYPNMDVVWGYLTHEAAHVRLSDFNVPFQSPLHKSILNAIEDCRIEREMIRVFPGTAKTLGAIPQHMIGLGHYQHVTEDDHPADMVGNYCMYWLQCHLVDQPILKPYADSAFAAIKQTLPAGVGIRLQVLLRKVPELKSTLDASLLASEIIKMIEEEKEDAENNANQDQTDTSQADAGQPAQPDGGQTGNGQDQGQANSGATSPPLSASADNQGDGGAGQQQDSSAQGKIPSPNSGQEQRRTAKEQARRLAQLLGAGDSDLPVDAQSILRQELSATQAPAGDPSYMTVRQASQIPNSQRGKELLHRVKDNSSRIRQQLFGLVQAQNRVAHRVEKRGKRLDHTKLSRLVSGDSRVFKQTADKRHPNTAVHLLVDCSGSMNKKSSGDTQSPGEIASEAALSIALALEAISGVNPAVTFFGNTSTQPVYYAVKHGQRVQPNSGRFVVDSKGGTPMAEAIWHSAFELSKTREQRKLLIVISDGAPSNRPAVKKVVELCESSDMEVIGIGINTDEIAGLFHPSIVINSVNELRRTLFKLMESSLLLAA